MYREARDKGMVLTKRFIVPEAQRPSLEKRLRFASMLRERAPGLLAALFEEAAAAEEEAWDIVAQLFGYATVRDAQVDSAMVRYDWRTGEAALLTKKAPQAPSAEKPEPEKTDNSAPESGNT